jgi:hypothetical protein
MATIDDVVQKFSDLRDATKLVKNLQREQAVLEDQITALRISLAAAKANLAQIQVEAKQLARDVL